MIKVLDKRKNSWTEKLIDFFSKEDNTKKINKLNFIYSISIALTIVFLCSFSNPGFFFFDDAQNNFLPYLKSAGKIWMNGEIPFIIKDTLIGQNQMIEIQRAIFLPQNIIISILSNIISFEATANILAVINLSIISFFTLKIGDALKLKRTLKIVMAFLFGINPIFLYMYSSSWWNEASAQAWFVMALASIFLLRNKFCKKYLILNIIAVLFLFMAGWSHSLLFYFFLILFFAIEKIQKKEYRELGIFTMLFVGILLVVSSIYSEYFLSLNLINISFGFGNFENFLSPNFNQIFMTFNPLYYTFMNRYGGYLLTYIPIAFSSIYILVLLCYQKNFFKLFSKNKNLKFISLILLTSFVLSQLPTQFGFMRLNFKFLPIFSEILIIFSIYGLEISELKFNKKRNYIFVRIILMSCLLSFFSVEESHMKIFRASIVFIILTVAYIYTIIKNKKINFFSSIFYNLFMLLFMLFIQMDVNGILPDQGLKKNINLNNINNNGYFLSLTNGNETKENIEDLYSAQFLLYGVKSINGYISAGNKKLSELLDITASQSFNIEETVNKLSKHFNEVCYLDLANINSIAIKKKDLTKSIKNRFTNCGYSEKSLKNSKEIFFVKSISNTGNISYFSDGIDIKNKINKANIEKYQISSSKEGFLVLSRAYWKGYRAKINGKKVNISNEKGLLKLDNIPNGLDNAILEIKYFPTSWKISLWLTLLGIVLIVYILIDKKKIIEKTKG